MTNEGYLAELILAQQEQLAVKAIVGDVRFQRLAVFAHRKFEGIHALADWEDIFYDAVLRFVQMVKRLGKTPNNQLGTFYKICENICKEYTRRQKPLIGYFFEDLLIPSDLQPSAEDMDPEKLMYYFSQLDQQCQTLLEARYLWSPQEKSKENLSLLTEGRVSPTAISTTLNRCKNKLLKILRQNSDD